MQILAEYSKARAPTISRNIDSWLMEWESFEIMIKSLKIADFSDYKLIQEFLSASNSLLPMWVTNKRMEIFKVSDKTSLKSIDVLLEFRQFWSLTEFENNLEISAFSASLQGIEQSSTTQLRNSHNLPTQKRTRRESGQVRSCPCGEAHPGEECFFFGRRKSPSRLSNG